MSKEFYLVDPQTLVPIEKFATPTGIAATGQVRWNPENSVDFVSWCSTFVETGSGSAVRVCSGVGTSAYAPLEQVDFLQVPSLLAQHMLPDLQQIAGDAGSLELVDARYGQTVSPAIQQQAREIQGMIPNLTRIYALSFDATFRFTKNGQPWFGYCGTPLIVFESQGPMVMFSNVRFCMPVYYACPEAGKAPFEAKVRQILDSRQRNPRWQQMTDEISLSIMNSRNQNMRAMLAQRQAAIRRTQQDFQASDASKTHDRVFDMWDNYIKDTEAVPDPTSSGDSLLISSQSEHAWQNADREVIYTDDSFNPNQSEQFNNQNWTQIK